MINIFTPADTDQSVYYLGQIFGYVGSVLSPTSASQILGTMFKVFNTVVLAVGALIVLYVTIVGVMKTAHEGEFMGKNWNNIWIPIRMVLGIAALVPSASGYCAIQMLVMWIVLQGVGAADRVWNAVLGYTDMMGSPLSTITVPSVGVSNNFQNLFQGLVCQATAKQSNTMNSGSPGGYYCASNTGTDFCGMSSQDMLNISDPQVNKQVYLSSISAPSTFNNGQMTSGPTQQIITYSMGPAGACGSMTYCDPTWACQDTSSVSKQIQCNSCQQQQKVLQSSVTYLGALANTFATADYTFRSFAQTPAPATDQSILNFCKSQGLNKPEQCCVPLVSGAAATMIPSACKFPSDITTGDFTNAATATVQTLYWPYMLKPSIGGDADFIGTITNNYVSVLNSAVLNTITQEPATPTVPKDQTLQEAQAQGWIFAGAYYYYLAKMNNQNVEAAIPIFTSVGNDPKADPNSPLSNLRNNYTAAGDLLNTPGSSLSQSSQSTLTTNLPPQLSGLNKLSSGLQNSGTNVMSAFETMITGAGQGQKTVNPLAQLQTLGKILLIIAQVLFALVMVVIPVMTILGSFAPFVLGTGAITGIGYAIQTLVVLFAPVFTLFLGALFTFGALLAIYTPLIPYIIFTMGAISWFILIIEAMVAAPLVALGILMPSGHHEILGKADAALMLVFGIFLRPTLMIFGMIAAMLMSIVTVTMINAGFAGVMGSIYSNPGLVELIIFMGAYVALVLAALNKSFALIHLVPDRALRWIGHQGGEEASGAASEGLQAAKSGAQQSSGALQKAGGQQAQKGAALGGKIAKDVRAKADHDEDSVNPDITPTGKQ